MVLSVTIAFRGLAVLCLSGSGSPYDAGTSGCRRYCYWRAT